MGTFGRGIYILDDYSPIRHLTPDAQAKPAVILPIKKALLYVPAAPLAGGEKAFQGASFYTAPNPPFGATFTYFLKDAIKTKKAARRDAGEEARAATARTWATRAGTRSRRRTARKSPGVVLTIRNSAGQVVRRLGGPTTAGLHRVSWDLRWPGYRPITGRASGARGQ